MQLEAPQHRSDHLSHLGAGKRGASAALGPGSERDPSARRMAGFVEKALGTKWARLGPQVWAMVGEVDAGHDVGSTRREAPYGG
jgi:hypothetical protein